MSKLFYDHLIIIEEIVAVLDSHKLSKEEKEKLLAVIDETLHHHILDIILTHLPKEHHEEFLKKLITHPYDPTLIHFLKEKIDVDIEKEILKTAEKVKRQVLKEIEAAK